MSNYILQKRVYYHDTDCGGVVYYANYLKFLEEARTEHLASMGIDLRRLREKEGILFAVSGVEIKYRAPAVYGDELLLLSFIEKAGAASISFRHEIKRGSALLVECRARLVSIDMKFRPVAMPDHVAKALSAAAGA